MSSLRSIAPLAAAALAACASARSGSGARPASAAVAPGGWPEDWALRFALGCAREGNDARFCSCLAGEVERRFTPESFAERGPDELDDPIQACRERLGGEGR